ncbi:MAG: hypothetical protein MUF49_24355 [Oculatellaceae cyanobacterium Prado106]|jgi:hypothetical protein|nr:hypothetical protein [Oculatellaceae cyanobacterium Prado106]
MPPTASNRLIPQSTSQSSSQSTTSKLTAAPAHNPFLEVELPNSSDDIYEPTPAGLSGLVNVDRFLDDIFEDVDHMLQGGSLPAHLTQPPAPAPVRPLMVPTLPAPPPRSALALETIPAHDDFHSDPNLDELIESETERSAKAARRSSHALLVATTIAIVMFSAGLWVTLKYRLYRFLPIPGMAVEQVESAAPTAANPQLQAGSGESHPQQPFLTYFQQALAKIDRATSASRPTGSPVILVPPPVVPPPPSTIGAIPAQPNTSGAIATAPAPAAQPAPIGRVTVPGNKPPTAPAQRAATPTGAAPAAKPAAQPAARPNPQPAPQAATAPASPAAAAPSPIAAITPNFDPNETHALIGLLELGDRSAALLEVNGVPQRLQVGETIGASGWTILSISNQAAVIGRSNGETRSIYVGQEF